MATRFSGSFYRYGRRALRLVVFLILGLAVLAQSRSPMVQAQSQSPNYWQYPASGRLRHVLTADVNHDGIDEFLVADENGNVDLLSSNGALIWSYHVQEPITSIGTVNVDGTSHPELEIALGRSNRLTLLAATGEELWSAAVPALPFSADASVEEEATTAAPVAVDAIPITVKPFDHDDDGNEAILVLTAGILQLYDASGGRLWQYAGSNFPEVEGKPLMAVGDLDGSGTDEIALGFFNPQRRFSQLIIIDAAGQLMWDQEQSISGRITALTLVTFEGRDNPLIAVGNNIGHVNVFDGQRQRLWQRTLNKPITSLAAANLMEGPGLVAGTNVGSIVAFSREGRRSWVRYLAPDADRSILALVAASSTPNDSQPTLSAIVAAPEETEAPGDVVLLGSNGRTLELLSAVDTAGLTQLTDINKDGNSELLLARFSQVELLGLGLGASEIAKGWDYNLFSEPSSVLVADLDQDGSDELLIGTRDGRIHSLDNNKSIRWLHAPGGDITHLALLPDPSNGLLRIVGVRNAAEAEDVENDASSSGWLELRQANGEQIWELELSTRITALEVADVNNDERAEIIVGMASGETMVHDDSGNLLWTTRINGSVDHLLALNPNSSNSTSLLASSDQQIFGVGERILPWRVAVYPQAIQGIYALSQTRPEQTPSILVFVADGTVRSQVVTRGGPRAQEVLGFGGRPVVDLRAEMFLSDSPEENLSDAFFVATDASQLLHITVTDNSPALTWRQTGLTDSSSMYLSDLDGDTLPELAVGNLAGEIQLIKLRSNNEPFPVAALKLSSKVLALTAMRRESDQESDLLAIAENGLVQLFRTQQNWPPLLTSPRTDVSQNQYSIVVSVHDIENDDVFVRMDVLDPTTGAWMPQGEKHLDGTGSLFWLVDNTPSDAAGVKYRFHYDDGFHQGYVLPPIGPAAPPPPPVSLRLTPANLGVLGAAGVALVFVLMRQSQLPAARARRFYRRLEQQPTQTLPLLEQRYQYTEGSPDFLLHLASRARQRGNSLVASLSDGLFLLVDQPHAGLPIILRALEACSAESPPWAAIERWRMTHRMGRLLLDAPTITELTLLRPQLVQLIDSLEASDAWSPVLNALLPILSNIRDSERVDLAEDRIVYLNEAATQLNNLQAQLPEFSISIEKTMVVGIIGRWLGLISAEIEDLNGRAELAITLRTKRIAPSDQTDVVLAIRNYGRAAAENLIVVLDDDPAYNVCSSPQVVRFLPPGRTRQISFSIEPQVSDRFRISLKGTFDDRNRKDRAVAFGDMVHLLPPVRDFSPIANPYLPGTPLRRNSPIFYGREELFNFISENAGELSQRNVLILVGERRTGKTSVLLRLDQHLPSHLIPVYIDCQSLGVLSGMPALLHDLSWYVADALAARGLAVDVPEPALWQEDPSGLFERRFLPQVKSLLPAEATLLLVFDEFEAFENLVDDGILPPTLFPYLRHLMQHSEGLSFVFVGTRRLEEMSADYWSVLFNIALYRKIGYLSDHSATQLICEPVKPNLIYDDLALDKILRVTTGHPYFLQLVCYTLVKRANAHKSGYATISDVNAALDEMLRLGEVHFAYLWQRSTHIERALLTVMAHLIERDTPFHPADLMKLLRPYGMHLNPAQVTTALTRLVDRDILREVREGAITLYEMKIGLVGLWVAQYKSLSTLLVGNGEAEATATSKV